MYCGSGDNLNEGFSDCGPSETVTGQYNSLDTAKPGLMDYKYSLYIGVLDPIALENAQASSQ